VFGRKYGVLLREIYSKPPEFPNKTRLSYPMVSRGKKKGLKQLFSPSKTKCKTVTGSN
jgi:hypothetical protein